jgi:hypothetical protein
VGTNGDAHGHTALKNDGWSEPEQSHLELVKTIRGGRANLLLLHNKDELARASYAFDWGLCAANSYLLANTRFPQ